MRRAHPASISLVAIAVTAIAGCKPESRPGPIDNHLSTPIELALAGSAGNVLLVSNANFQLQYDQGSLEALDLGLVDESKRLNLVDDVVLSSVPLPDFSGPIALTSDGGTALVPNRFSAGSASSAPD